MTNVSNREKHYESYWIQFCLKDLLYVCADTHTQKAEENTKTGGVGGKSVCQQPGMVIFNQMQPS